VRFPGSVTTDELLATVSAAGYAAALPTEVPSPGADQERHDAELAALRRRLVVSAALSVPVVTMAMVPALQPDGWQWVSLALALPVAVWGAWPFHRGAWVNLRRGAATMDTLVSLGVLAALTWSLAALAFGLEDIYLEVAAAVTTFLLTGRYLERRARRRAGEALRALLRLGAREATVLRAGVEERVRPRSSPSARCWWCDPANASPPTASWSADRPLSTPRC
jgi:Cu+-exporting ATPase